MRMIALSLICGIAMLAGCMCGGPSTTCQETSDCPAGYRCDQASSLCVASRDGSTVDAALADSAPADTAMPDAPVPDQSRERFFSDRPLDESTLDGGGLDSGMLDVGPRADARRDVVVERPAADAVTTTDSGMSAREAGNGCVNPVCPANFVCASELDGGYRCDCDGVVCDSKCFVDGRCCPTSGCSNSNATCNTDHRCVVTIVLQQGANGYAGCTATYIDSYAPDQMHVDPSDLWVRAEDLVAGLIRFDIAAIPAGAQVTSAGLRLYSLSRTNVNCVSVALFRVLRAWDPDTSTWYQAGTGDHWNLAGCNGIGIDRSESATAPVVLDILEQWHDFDVTTDVQAWVASPGANFGLVLKAVDWNGSVAFSIASPYYWNTMLRPELRIVYIEP